MILTTIIAQNNSVQINIPNSYIGKKVHALIYIEEEVVESPNQLFSSKPSDFFGTLSKEQCLEMNQQAKEARKEWNRDI